MGCKNKCDRPSCCRGRIYGGTFAHKDIAFEFGMWISAEFMIYLIREFQRLKEQEKKQLGWDIKRNLAKINYRIHSDAIKENLIPPELTAKQTNLVYVSEADVLNMPLFGMTAKSGGMPTRARKETFATMPMYPNWFVHLTWKIFMPCLSVTGLRNRSGLRSSITWLFNRWYCSPMIVV